MSESEFNKLADAVFSRIEHVLESSDSDIDFDNNGAVMEIEFGDGSKLIVNRHAPNQEIWLAAKSGGYHFGFREGNWISQRDGSELYAKLGQLVQMGSGENLKF